MIPIRDTQPSSNVPVVTYSLIALNAAVFLVQLLIGLDNQAFFYTFGLVPAKYTVRNISAHFSTANHLISLFSYMFLHGGFLHFIGNMWTLYIFGDNVEEYFGAARYLGFYLFFGTISGIFHFLSQPTSMTPTIGASGAIAGVMGAYFLLYPKSRILTLIPIIIIPFFIEIPAFIFLGFWFLLQFVNATGTTVGGGVAWWAHIGGFLCGLAVAHFNRRVPGTGVSNTISRFTAKKRTPKLQVIRLDHAPNGTDLYGRIEISSIEAITGAKKLVSIPWGFYKSIYRVNVPAGVRQGTKLKLSGMGKTSPTGIKGDLFLEVNIRNAI